MRSPRNRPRVGTLVLTVPRDQLLKRHTRESIDLDVRARRCRRRLGGSVRMSLVCQLSHLTGGLGAKDLRTHGRLLGV